MIARRFRGKVAMWMCRSVRVLTYERGASGTSTVKTFQAGMKNTGTGVKLRKKTILPLAYSS